MSRIEKALEMAIQTRSEGLPAVEEKKPVLKETQPSALTPPRIVTIDTANRLLTTINDPNSFVSEQYRKLKSGLVRIANEGAFHNLLMVTSAIAGEGKSLTAVNLALSMAKGYNLTVLLIDADFRNPSVNKLLGFEASFGLVDCLLDGVAVSEAIVKTDIDKLSVIPAGRVVENPLELFTSKKMQGLMQEIKHRYHDRYIILDTPPLLPFAETRCLAALVDGIVFVIHEGSTSQESVLEANELLKGCRMLGVVLNDSTSISREHNHYNTYYGAAKSRG